MSEEEYAADMKKRNEYYPSSNYGGASQMGEQRPGYGVEGYGAHAAQPPTYRAGVGEPAGSALQGQQYPREKR